MKKKYKDVYYDVPDVKTIKELVIHGVGEGKDQPLFMYDNVNGTKDNPFITKTFNDVWHDINCLPFSSTRASARLSSIPSTMLRQSRR